MRRWALRLLALAACLLVVAAGSGAWIGRSSLPELDGTIAADGLDGPASIARDRHGVALITATNRADLAFATGVAHGQDRFFQMDLIRRRAAGELSELFGAVALGSDREHRFHRFRARARTVLAGLDPDERLLIERYAAGVNAGLESLDAKPFEYFLIDGEPVPWRPEDTLVVVYAMFMQLNDARARTDVRHGLAYRVLPESVYEWLYPDGTPWDAPLVGEARSVRPWPPADVYDVRRFRSDPPVVAEAGPPPFVGSNNWAVSGAVTGTGRAMVANDMHLGLAVPNIWYRARLVQTDGVRRDVTGVTLPGAPFVVAGSNGHVAWGYTNSQGDWSDAVIVRPGAAPGTYRTAEGDRTFEEHIERIAVGGGEAVEYRVRETVWGPVDDGVDYPEGEIAVSWIAHHPRAVNLAILELETVATATEALDIANRMGLPPQNFVAGDAEGNIGWTIAGQIPARAAYFDATRPADWSALDGWVGWREPGAYPRLVNPPGGRIWTANARVVDGPALGIVGHGSYDLGARARQIRDALFARERLTAEDMLAIQNDDRALFLAPWRGLLLEVLDEATVANEPALRAYRDLVADWVPRATPGSVGYRLVRGFRLEVRSRVFAGLMAPVRPGGGDALRFEIGNQFEAPLWQLVTGQPPHLLPADYETWHALLLAAVRANIDHYEREYGRDLAERTWGELNTADIRHPLSLAVPALSRWLDMPPDALSGDANLPKAQAPSFGASERFAVSPGDEANGLMQMPAGQSGHPWSPFYRAGHDAWVAGTPAPFLPGESRHTLKLVPAGGTLGSSGE